MRKERPILFSAPMVRALLAGTKTQTRRVVKHTPALGFPEDWPAHLTGERIAQYGGLSSCPYGEVGDRLWVRETFTPMGRGRGDAVYFADWEQIAEAERPKVQRWKPSIFMPRKLCRIMLAITRVRVERLQDITEADALAEGISSGRIPADEDGPERIGYMAGPDDGNALLHVTAREAYQALWCEINGAPSWAANVWVWVLEFQPLQQAAALEARA